MGNKTENICVKVDQNNLIYIDPNSVVDNGQIYPRNVEQENLVMYVNLEADVIPRTTLIASGDKTSLISIAEGKFNFLRKQNGGDYDTSWTDIDFTSSQNTSDTTGQSFGIDSININIKGGGFIPQININFIDVRGKTLYESPKNSPYKTFFHLPWPIFYLTVKGFYGKAIRYRLHLAKFSTAYNGSTGNFEISTTFIGSTYAYLNDIPLMGILNAPLMFLSEQENNGTFNEKTGKYEKIINRTSRGYVMLQSIYKEYIEKGYLPKDFPNKTLREVITIASSLDKILEKEIFGQQINKRVFAGIKEFEEVLQKFDTYIISWGDLHLSKEYFIKDDVVYRKLLITEKPTLKNVKGDEKSQTLQNGIRNYIKTLKNTQLFANDILNNTTGDFKKITFQNGIENIDSYIGQDGENYGIAINKIRDDIKLISSTFITQRDRVITDVEKAMNNIISDKEKGIGFEPTIRNIFAIVLANADVYIRLLKETHRKSFDVGNQRSLLINKLSDETNGKPIFPWPEIKKLSATTKQKILAYPADKQLKEILKSDDSVMWPEIDFVENYYTISTKRLDTLVDKEKSSTNVTYILPNDAENVDTIKISTLFQLTGLIPYTNKSLVSVLYEIWERSKYITLTDSFTKDTIRELADIEFDNIQTILGNDFDIIDILKKINTEEKLKESLITYSLYERYPYFKDQLPTVPYIKDIIESNYKIEEYRTITKNIENNNEFTELPNNLKNYKIEPYRKNIYPFNSQQYLNYIYKNNLSDDDFNIKGNLNVNTREGFITSIINPSAWSKNKTNLFTEPLKINKDGDVLLNTPIFHNQLYNDFNKTTSYGKYVGSAYLLLNSLPFHDLNDEIVFNFEGLNFDKIRMSFLFKEIGASHYIPYHLLLKWGAIYHRYKTYLLTGNDILEEILNNNETIPLNGVSFFDSSSDYFLTYNAFDSNNNVNIQVTYDNRNDFGFHPFYQSIFNQIVNGYSTYDTFSEFLNKTTTKSINLRTRYNSDKKYHTLFVDNNKYKNSDNFYTLLPSDGGNSLTNFNNVNFIDNEQSNFRIIWKNLNQNTSYNGIAYPTYNEYHQSVKNNTYELSEEYRKIFDLIGTFSPTILDKFEKLFINFSSENIKEDLSTNQFSHIKYTNFQTLLKELVTVDRFTASGTVNELIEEIKTKQNIKLEAITKTILNENNLMKITLGNPKEIDAFVWSGFSDLFPDITFNHNTYSSTQISGNKKYIKLYIGDDNEGEMYSKYLNFFTVNNIELSEENCKTFRPLVLIYAGYLKSGGQPDKQSFQEYLRNNIFTSVNGALNRHLFFITYLTSKFPSLKSKTNEKKIVFNEGHNEDPLKLELYNFFKSFNDKWIAGNSIGQRLLIEEFLFLNKANKDIGNEAFLTLERIASLGLRGNAKQNLYGVISILIQGSGFDMRALPAYVNFYGKQSTSKNIATNLFGTFLDVDYQESSPKIIIQYTGPTSKHLDMKEVSENENLYRDDSFNIGDPNNNSLIITNPSAFTDKDLEKSNKVVAFEVNIGDQSQSIFKSVQLDQTSIRNTSESFVVMENISRAETGSATHQVDIGLYDIYRQASYTCEVTCMGNVMIQPTMFFYLKNIPMFRGSYWITDVSHTIQNNNISTTFKGTRIPFASLPDPKDSYMASYRILFDKMSNKAIAKQKQEDALLTANKPNETPITTNKGNFVVDFGTNAPIKGEVLVKETGITELGLRYNGEDGEKYIQKVKYSNTTYFRAVATILGKKYPIDDDVVMNVFTKSQHITVESGNLQHPNQITWGDIKKSKNYFYSLRFDTNMDNDTLNRTVGDRILSATTIFYNPNNLEKTQPILPYITNNNPQPTVTGANIRGPVLIGPNINGVGIGLSEQLARKLDINEGDVVYFRFF